MYSKNCNVNMKEDNYESVRIPHRGSLFRVNMETPEKGDTDTKSTKKETNSSRNLVSSYYMYTISIRKNDDINHSDSTTTLDSFYELHFQRDQYEFLLNLFSIIDTESKGMVSKKTISDFVQLRCPLFRRRDMALEKLRQSQNEKHQCKTLRTTEYISQTFEDIWEAVIACSNSDVPENIHDDNSLEVMLGIEGWMVFCRFISLAQYQEAKRRFSERHLQQSMCHKNEDNGSEVIMVNVPPPDPPAPLSVTELIEYERIAIRTGVIPIPELDLDHCYISAYDKMYRSNIIVKRNACVRISVFGLTTDTSPSSSLHENADNIEFILKFYPHGIPEDNESPTDFILVRRSYADMEWLHDTFTSHKELGGTLCGRILPPLPSRLQSNKTDYKDDFKSEQSSSSTAIAVASAGVGMIASAAKSAKSLWGGYIYSSGKKSKTSTISTSSPKSQSLVGKKSRRRQYYAKVLSFGAGDDYRSEISFKACQLERYINYLLDHPALSTSFSLNTVLMASQSGLDAAKRILMSDKKRTQSLGTNLFSSFSYSSLHSRLLFSTHKSKKTPLIRTAAQAALALKVDDILESTGYHLTSSKIQHASLPKFSVKGKPSWSDDDGGEEKSKDIRRDGSRKSDCEFENGVVNVESELRIGETSFDDFSGYDLLPAQVPISERSALCAGIIVGKNNETTSSETSSVDYEERDLELVSNIDCSNNQFNYGMFTINDNDRNALLGDITVDKDIKKLRSILRSVDSSVGKCLDAIVKISEAVHERTLLHLSILKGLDSWGGLKGELIGQRALFMGVDSLQKAFDIGNKNGMAFSSDLSWHASLASSALSAADDVQTAVDAADTATRAKLAANSAAREAHQAYTSVEFTTKEEAEIAQKRLSDLQSHAVNAAVIEHEALSAKRHAAVALANDVKCWNVHRKQGMLRTCIETTKAQILMAHQSKVAWEELRDGFLAPLNVPVVVKTRYMNHDDLEGSIETTSVAESTKPNLLPPSPEVRLGDFMISNDHFTYSHDVDSSIESPNHDHDGHPNANSMLDDYGSINDIEILSDSSQDFAERAHNVKSTNPSTGKNSIIITNMNTSQIPLEENIESLHASFQSEESQVIQSYNNVEVVVVSPTPTVKSNEDDNKVKTDKVIHDEKKFITTQPFIESMYVNDDASLHASSCENDLMSDSMQSLVDGLMNWGGKWDSDDDLALPHGMVASIAMEEEAGVLE